jgi:hypothetical protein
MPRGSKPGERRGGRKPGTPNKITREKRELLAALLDKRLPDLDAMIEDTWRGIEIEKQLPTGETVVGRFNASPADAAKLVLTAAEFAIPKLARMEKTIADASDEELLSEVRRRAAQAAEASKP